MGLVSSLEFIISSGVFYPLFFCLSRFLLFQSSSFVGLQFTVSNEEFCTCFSGVGNTFWEPEGMKANGVDGWAKKEMFLQYKKIDISDRVQNDAAIEFE